MPLLFPVRKLLLFALLSLSDFGLTCYLLRASGGAVYESNPVAAWCLGRFGWLGLATFKAATMALGAGLGVLVFLRRPRTGDRVLTFGCAALAAVVLYSGYLCDAVRRRPAGLDPAEAARLEEVTQSLDEAMQRGWSYREVLQGVLGDLRDRRCTLEQAVARLAATEQARDGRWLRHFQVYYPGRSQCECLALSLIRHFEASPDTPTARQVRHDLQAQFRALYGRDLPFDLDGPPAGRAPFAVGPSGRHPFGERPRMQ